MAGRSGKQIRSKPQQDKWIMEEYQDYTEGESARRNDSNTWSREHDDPAYILTLLQRVIRVIVETMGIVRTLPSLQG